MKYLLFLGLFATLAHSAFAQVSKDSIQADYVTQTSRDRFDVYLRDTAIAQAFAMPLDSDGEGGYETACLAASQFMIQSKRVEAGIKAIFSQYDSLQYSTKLAFFEAVYGLYPGVYAKEIEKLIIKETVPKFFAAEAAYLHAKDAMPKKRAYLLALLEAKFADSKKNVLLVQLRDYINNHYRYVKQQAPDITALFRKQQAARRKTIYSFQRWDRDYPGLAILQNADGTFARDSTGKLLVFRQLARAASNLPYFITDGNTPQGIYRITGLRGSSNHFLGPTPTIQMVMPFEEGGAFWRDAHNMRKDALGNYLSLLPAQWRNYKPITEAFYAGKIGRTAIICHGTTLNPSYFMGKPYYPISPTEGCLCARETWDALTGKLKESEELRLVNAFLATPGEIGYVMVINLDDKHGPVSWAEVDGLVKRFEK